MLEALTYPRMVVLANLDEEECSQHLYFNPAHPSCQICHQGEECRWLKGNNEFSVLAEKPMDALFQSLMFGIEYVDVQCSRASHNVRRCACESCRWVRDARRLERAYRNRNGV